MISILSIYDITTTIFDIISTLSLSSHPGIDDIISAEFMRSLPIYIWGNHNHCIQQHIHYICNITTTVSCLTPTFSMISHPLCVWHYTHYMFKILYTLRYHIHILWYHTTLFKTSHVLYSWHHPHYISNGLYHICVITMTLFMVSDQLYVWHHTHFTYAIVCTLLNVTSTVYDLTPL